MAVDPGAEKFRAMAVAFVRSVGIECEEREQVAGGFLDHIRIERGKLIIGQRATAADVLHEAGHLAVLPADVRAIVGSDVEAAIDARFSAFRDSDAGWALDGPYGRALVNCGDQEATAWGFAAGRAAGIPDEVSIADHLYEGSGRDVRRGLQCRCHAGINGLVASGMLERVKRYPELRCWLQDATHSTID